MIVFTSSATVSNLAEIMAPTPLLQILQGTRVAAIGPITAQTAERLGLTVSVQPGRYTVPALVQAIAEYFSG
jgi:uroporphyrinogen-III synthase